MIDRARLARITEWAAVVLCLAASGGVVRALLTPGAPTAVPEVVGIILVTLVVCIAHAGAAKGWRKALGFTAFSFVVTWVVEFVGCNYGWWFGDYHYTPALGIALGNVPLLVVVSWETVIYPAHLLADELVGQRGGLAQAALAALATAFIATAWDTMTDPMSVHMGWWAWHHGGGYLPELDGGIPFGNYRGWLGAVFLISFSYRLFFARGETMDTAASASSARFGTLLYSSLYIGSIGGLMQHGLYTPVFVGSLAMGPVLALAWARLLARQPLPLPAGAPAGMEARA